MQIVIKISDTEYESVKAHPECFNFANAIQNGIPLPKGHGRLIDVGRCDRKLFYQQCGGADALITVKNAFDMLLSLPTIIEADKESEDKREKASENTKMVTNAKEVEEYQISEDISKGFEEFTKRMFKQGQEESEG